jgi:hypothetical protein
VRTRISATVWLFLALGLSVGCNKQQPAAKSIHRPGSDRYADGTAFRYRQQQHYASGLPRLGYSNGTTMQNVGLGHPG